MISRWRRLLLASACTLLMNAAVAMELAGTLNLQNSSFIDSTYLIDLQQGSRLSEAAMGLGGGGFELAGGHLVSFSDWYKSKWTDASITWMTQVTPDFGVIFGFSTGERGKKYSINPSLKLGVLMQTQTGKNAFLSLRATTTLGGDLREKTCIADYGEIGGVQEVNCRLAASTIPPSETLKYLVNQKPYNRNQVSLMLTWGF